MNRLFDLGAIALALFAFDRWGPDGAELVAVLWLVSFLFRDTK